MRFWSVNEGREKAGERCDGLGQCVRARGHGQAQPKPITAARARAELLLSGVGAEQNSWIRGAGLCLSILACSSAAAGAEAAEPNSHYSRSCSSSQRVWHLQPSTRPGHCFQLFSCHTTPAPSLLLKMPTKLILSSRFPAPELILARPPQGTLQRAAGTSLPTPSSPCGHPRPWGFAMARQGTLGL